MHINLCVCVCVVCVAVCLSSYVYVICSHEKGESLKVNRMQVTCGGFGCLRCFTPCLSAVRPVAVCCQSYQREWQCPQKGMAMLQYIRTINYPDNNNECCSWQVACYFIIVQLTPSPVPSWHRPTFKPNQALCGEAICIEGHRERNWDWRLWNNWNDSHNILQVFSLYHRKKKRENNLVQCFYPSDVEWNTEVQQCFYIVLLKKSNILVNTVICSLAEG